VSPTPTSSEPTARVTLPYRRQSDSGDNRVARLIDEMTERWRKGERPRVEQLLDQQPDLWNRPAVVMDLVYEEICLRLEHGETVDPEEIAKRFPQWQQQIEILLRCIQTLQTPCTLPCVGETFEDFQLLAELGRGGQGRVFVATQSSLGDRPVVLKITPCRGDEHLSLARLQHTHIVPLLSVHNDSDRNLRVLCLPYFGGLTLAAILEKLGGQPQEKRSGRHILEAIDNARTSSPVVLATGRDPARPFLERATYVQAISWIGACLAEALKYAHDRGLVHLDVKPSNVLVTANFQPMLLDFHLAREPLYLGDPGAGLGGTPGYMSPEQEQAMAAIKKGAAVAERIDGRSDIYLLGLVMYEALGGPVPIDHTKEVVPLHRCNPQVPRGLSDIIAKCLSRAALHRYQSAGMLAADLWAHLNDLPLKGVANRNLAERWGKWRRRKPHLLTVICLIAAVLMVSAAALVLAYTHAGHRVDEARTALADGTKFLTNGHYSEAASAMQRGLSELARLPGNQELKRDLESGLEQATRLQLAKELHEIANRFRILYVRDNVPSAELASLQEPCAKFWEKRQIILDKLGKELEPKREQRIRLDLLDLAILGSELRIRLIEARSEWSAIKDKKELASARRDALEMLAQAEALFGPNAVLYHERFIHAEALGQTDVAIQARQRAAALQPRTAWEHYALGRSLMNDGHLEAAAMHLDRATALQPNGLWPNFYRGHCCYRLGRFEDSALAFTACTAIAPDIAGCFYNRALAFIGLGRADRALADLNRALELDPGLSEASLQRRMLQFREKTN
jgi:eukaryotic-like serine/threonine-protein kinase